MKLIFRFQASLGGLPSVCQELSMREFTSCGLNFGKNKSKLEIIPLITLQFVPPWKFSRKAVFKYDLNSKYCEC